MSSFAKFLIIILIAFICAVFIFWFFDTNEAAFGWDGDAARFGGPIAGFFGTIFVLVKAVKQLQTSDAEITALVASARRKEIEDLVGTWKIESESNHSARKAGSETQFKDDNGRLRIIGGTFLDRSDDGSLGAPIGDWTTEAAIYDGTRLIYLYTLTDRTSDGGGRVWRGVVDARLNSSASDKGFLGRWEVFGADHHDGTIRLTRG